MAQYIKTEEGYKKLATFTNDKMDKFDPVGIGSFSMNRKVGTVIGVNSHAEGERTTASGGRSHAEGYQAIASGTDSHAEGNDTTASGGESHAEGERTTASGGRSHAEGSETVASGEYSHAEGLRTTASREQSHAEGYHTIASGEASHAEGYLTTASGFCSHAEGYQSRSRGKYSHAEGGSTNAFSSVVTTTNPTTDSIITAWETKKFSVAHGFYSHIEGKDNLALGEDSHAEGYQTTASGNYSHAEGSGTTARGFASHAEGNYTTASGDYSHVQGKYNIEDTSNTYADIIGNGASTTARSNAATVDWNGNAWFAGDVYTGSTSGTNKDDGSKKLATEEYVNSSIAAGSIQSDWNQNDETAKDYIKNRPFYEISEESAIFSGDVTFVKYTDSSPYAATYQSDSVGNVDNDYRIVIKDSNGEIVGDYTYSPVLSENGDTSYIMLGDMSEIQTSVPINQSDPNFNNRSFYTFKKFSANNICNITIYEKSLVVKQLDPKYIPVDAFDNKYTLPSMTGTALGGAMADPAQESDTQPVRIGGDGKLYTAAGRSDISLGLTSAAVGQIIKVKAVDESGKPTEWEAADMPSGGDEWELIAHINVVDDVEKGVTVWEYNNLPRYKYIAYKKVSLVGSSDQTASGCTIMINGESSQPSGMTYGKSGSPQSCIGVICVMPFGWTHCKTADANTPNNIALGGVSAMLTALPLSDNAITSIKLSAHPTYKIASGEIWLYGKKG